MDCLLNGKDLSRIEHETYILDSLPERSRLLNLYISLLNIPFINRKVAPLITNFFDGTHKAALSPGFKCLYGNIHTGENVALNDTLVVDYAPIILMDNVSISFKNMLITSTHDFLNFKRVIAKPIVLEDNVWITSGCIILGGVRIGKNTVVSSGSVVTKSMPANVLVAGNPARVIKEIVRSSP